MGPGAKTKNDMANGTIKIDGRLAVNAKILSGIIGMSVAWIKSHDHVLPSWKTGEEKRSGHYYFVDGCVRQLFERRPEPKWI